MRTVSESDLVVPALDVREHAFPLDALRRALAVVFAASLLSPYRMQSRDRLRQIAPRRVEIELELPRERRAARLFRRYPLGSPHGRITPSRIEMRGSPRMSSSLTRRRVPSPPHVGQAPNGELNEKCRGSSSGSEMPHVGQP